LIQLNTSELNNTESCLENIAQFELNNQQLDNADKECIENELHTNEPNVMTDQIIENKPKLDIESCQNILDPVSNIQEAQDQHNISQQETGYNDMLKEDLSPLVQFLVNL
jgi:hypothetical protein